MGYVLGHTPFHVVLTLGMFVHFLAGAIALDGGLQSRLASPDCELISMCLHFQTSPLFHLHQCSCWFLLNSWSHPSCWSWIHTSGIACFTLPLLIVPVLVHLGLAVLYRGVVPCTSTLHRWGGGRGSCNGATGGNPW